MLFEAKLEANSIVFAPSFRDNRREMGALNRILKTPRYGFEKKGILVVPNRREILAEYFRNLNFIRDRKNWLTFVSVFPTAAFMLVWIPLLANFTWPSFGFAIFYAMFVLNIHNTAYTHRFAAHSAFDFPNRFAALLFQNLTIKVVTEEAFAISHHVHHGIPDEPGDPHNPRLGWLAVMFSDGLTHAIRTDFTEEEYARVSALLGHVPIRTHSYAEYRKWGTISRPLDTVALFLLNWAVWGVIFFALGGAPFVYAAFAGAGIWGVSVRNFNYKSHGSGEDRRIPGRDFSERDLSVNNRLAGMVAGEWHSNHHVTPTSARNGYLPGQWDFAWWVIRGSHTIGLVSGYRNHREEFLKRARIGPGHESHS